MRWQPQLLLVYFRPHTNNFGEKTNMALTDLKVRSLKPASNTYTVSDSGGLHVMVMPTGSKLWRLAYRFAGKQKSLALGKYPAVSLRDARDIRDAAKQLPSLEAVAASPQNRPSD